MADQDLYTSVLVVGEIRRGIELLRRRDPTAAATLDQWLRRLSETYGERILPIDRRVAECWGALNVPDPVPAVDGLLAATAMEHELTLGYAQHPGRDGPRGAGPRPLPGLTSPARDGVGVRRHDRGRRHRQWPAAVHL